MENSWVVLRGLVSGALVAAMSSLLSAAIYIQIMVGFRESRGFGEAFLFVGSIAFLASLLLASVLGLLVGVPMFRASLRTRRTAVGSYIRGGAVVAIFVIAVAALCHVFFGFLLRSDMFFLAASALIGAPAAAVAFWVVVRPDKLQSQ